MPACPHSKHKVSSPVHSPRIKAPPCLSAESVAVEEPASERLKPEPLETRPKEKPPSPAAKAVPTPAPRQSTATKLPAVHPARLRKLSFLPTPRTQGPEDVVQAFISEIGECYMVHWCEEWYGGYVRSVLCKTGLTILMGLAFVEFLWRVLPR